MKHTWQKPSLSAPLPFVIGLGLWVFALLCVVQAWSRDSTARIRQDDKELVAKGKKAFNDYECFDCHGRNGEGTYDGPDLTNSHLTGSEIAKFLQRPSADADARGMPSIPADSPDLQPLVAYVLSLRKPPPK
jgi:mono/diheme cytochrome c family protein